jgi:uncharacterized membrane protein YjgN (DUF898 family)
MSQGGYGGGGGWGGGQPPGGQPQGGYGGPAPGAAPYGAPPGAAYGAPPMGGAQMTYNQGGMGGQRVVFTGQGGDLLGKFFLVYIPLVGTAMQRNGFNEWRWNSTTIDGQQCQYQGQWGDLMWKMILGSLLVMITCGFYLPWYIVDLKKFEYERVTVNGQPGRLRYEATGGDLWVKQLIGQLLLMVTCGIYMRWFVQDMFEFHWTKTTFDGRPFSFRKDVGGYFSTMFVPQLLTAITCGIYFPWAVAVSRKWECEHVS